MKKHRSKGFKTIRNGLIAGFMFVSGFSIYNKDLLQQALKDINSTDNTENIKNVFSDLSSEDNIENSTSRLTKSANFSLENIPEFNEKDAYVEVNDNIPYFTDEDKTRTDAFENYSDLDDLGRCGVAYASICKELMPTEERGSIGQVKPTGWHTVRYDDLISDKYLYNRCHLIGFQLAGENANEKNLITGTRYLNITGMLPFENEVTDYVKQSKNHVLYRVTPIFKTNELVARGVLMEAYSVEDQGEGIQFCVYCYNNQPGITIDYATGDSSRK